MIILYNNNTIINMIMEYQENINLIDNATNQPFKLRTRNQVEINYESKGKYDNSNIRFKTSKIRSNLCDYSDAYILVKRTITVPITEIAGTPVNNTNKKVIFKNCAPFTNWISKTDNTQVDDSQDIDIVVPMYDLAEYSDPYLKTPGSLCQYYREELAPANNNNIIDFPANNDNNSNLFKFKGQITAQTGNGGTKNL